MLKLKEWLFNLFHFNKQERNGVFVLIIIIFVLFTIKLFMPYALNHGDTTVQLINVQVNQPVIEFAEKDTAVLPTRDLPKTEYANVQSLFVFNPNTAGIEDLEKLGFSKKLATTLINYRNKGGKFFKTEDLKKLYGLSPKLYESVKNYVLIPNARKDSVYKSYKPFEKTIATKQLVELNTADSSAIVSLKGIGPGFTKRILKYRNMLGGFHSLSQLREVYGMTDSLYNFIVPQIQLDKNNIVKIPINAIDFNSLRKHFYFNFQSAQAIINYRSKHGRLTEVDIKGLGVFSEEKLALILPYLMY